jgi:glucose-6-phosphate isomerase
LPILVQRFGAVQDEVRARRGQGEYGFYGLAEQAETVQGITQFAGGVGQAFSHVLVLGIGGSALGTRALLNALRPPAWNELDDEGREFYPKITILENVDPSTVRAALRRIDPRKVLVNVVSKSGGTAETMAQYLVVRAWLEAALGPAVHRHLVFTTDPARGALRDIATREGIATLDVPPEVGGRFSVLSPVGLLPAALIGVDVIQLIAGAKRRSRARRGARPAQEPGGALRRPALGRRYTSRRAHRRAHAVHRPACAISPSGTGSCGRRAWASASTGAARKCSRAPRRWPPWGPPTSTVRCSCSWRGRSTR